MKRQTLFYLTILLASIIHLQSSCVKNHPDPKPKELPPITTEGRNTIGFLLNGEVWLPGGGGIGRPDKDFVVDTTQQGFDFFSISAYKKTSNDSANLQNFAFRVILPSNESKLGESILDSIIGAKYFTDYGLSECIDFEKVKKYKIEISFFDSVNQIISGTFELEIENECGDVYEITEGRFDGIFRYF